MLGRKKQTPPEEVGRRRPLQTAGDRQQAYSYYSRRTTDTAAGKDASLARRAPIPRDKRAIAKFAGQRFGLIIAVIASVALLISSIQVSMNPRVQIVNDTEVYRIHPNALYEEALNHELQGSWTNSNKITINIPHLEGQLMNDYPELADVSVVLPVIGQRPIAYLQLTRPSLLLVTTGGSAFVLDEAGRVLAPSSQVDNLDSFNLPTITDESGLDAKVGKLVLSRSTVSFIRDVTYQLKAAKTPYNKLVLPQASQELDVYVSGKPYYVRFNAHEDTAREQAGTYLAVQANLAKQGKVPSTYIDVRLPGRAYYK